MVWSIIKSHVFVNIYVNFDRPPSFIWPGVGNGIKKVGFFKKNRRLVTGISKTSDFPEITHWLVDKGVSSISLNPDSVMNMTEEVLKAESHLSAETLHRRSTDE